MSKKKAAAPDAPKEMPAPRDAETAATLRKMAADAGLPPIPALRAATAFADWIEEHMVPEDERGNLNEAAKEKAVLSFGHMVNKHTRLSDLLDLAWELIGALRKRGVDRDNCPECKVFSDLLLELTTMEPEDDDGE